MIKKIICFILTAIIVFSAFSLNSFAASGSIEVNGEAFSGTLAQAISSAGDGGLVEISGKIYTMPIGKNDGTLVKNITIAGKNNAQIILSNKFIMRADDNLDVLTIKGNNVTVKDVLIDARWKVDYPLNVFCWTTNLVIENVVVQHGIRGGVDIMAGGNVLFKNVLARNSLQGGFSIANYGDASGLKFENCRTSGNWYRSGVLICNGYGPSTNVDASGITCEEGYFSVHDRVAGTISGGERAGATFVAAPLDVNGNPISTDVAMYYPLEKAYYHIRFGVGSKEIKPALCYVDTDAYGFESRVYFDNKDKAKIFAHEGEEVVDVKDVFVLVKILYQVLFSMRINLF